MYVRNHRDDIGTIGTIGTIEEHRNHRNHIGTIGTIESIDISGNVSVTLNNPDNSALRIDTETGVPH